MKVRKEVAVPLLLLAKLNYSFLTYMLCYQKSMIMAETTMVATVATARMGMEAMAVMMSMAAAVTLLLHGQLLTTKTACKSFWTKKPRNRL